MNTNNSSNDDDNRLYRESQHVYGISWDGKMICSFEDEEEWSEYLFNLLKPIIEKVKAIHPWTLLWRNMQCKKWNWSALYLRQYQRCRAISPAGTPIIGAGLYPHFRQTGHKFDASKWKYHKQAGPHCFEFQDRTIRPQFPRPKTMTNAKRMIEAINHWMEEESDDNNNDNDDEEEPEQAHDDEAAREQAQADEAELTQPQEFEEKMVE